MERQDIVKELGRLLKSRNNDAVKLAGFGPEGAVDIDKLDLRSVVELKRSEKGCFEVKFIDKLKTVELLERLCRPEDGEELDAFLEGLRESESQ